MLMKNTIQEYKFKKGDLCFYVHHGDIVGIVEIIAAFPKYHNIQGNYISYTYNILCDLVIDHYRHHHKNKYFGLYEYVREDELEKFSLLKLLQHRLEIDNAIKLICDRYNASE